MERTIAVFLARTILGLMFFMTGVYRVFDLGPIEHARRFFVVPYANSILPAWALWVAGTTVPFLELAAGTAMLLGWRVREAAIGMGAVLVVVTFGHLLAEPFFAFDSHVMPRLLLLLFVLWVPRECDRWRLGARPPQGE